jgi:hypothetical protein
MGSYFQFEAMVTDKKNMRTFGNLSLVSIGRDKNDEITDTKEVEDGGLTMLVHKLKMPQKHHFSFTWHPPDEQKGIFKEMKGHKLDFSIDVSRSDSGSMTKIMTLVITDAVITGDIGTEHRKFKDFTRTDQRVNTTYGKCTQEDPKQ